MTGQSRKAKIGLALGSGSARGWSHIGVINALAKAGIEPDIVCGCSIGGLVGASYAAGNLKELECWARSLSRIDVARLLNFSMNGFVDVERLQSFILQYVGDETLNIETIEKTFATVATDLETGREVWFTEGSLVEAVWSSISLPGVFPPVRSQNRWLIDGGLVNPVPVSLCRALGADHVIAVNLNGDIVGKHFYQERQKSEPLVEEHDVAEGFAENITKALREYSSRLFGSNGKLRVPGFFDTLASSINITQDRITRSRMAGDPPDITLTPKLSHLGLLEFFRAEEAIAEGEDCVVRMMPQLQHFLHGD
ncbi:MAG: patatin [Desulfuromonadales bacterium C00003068]|nr:MAG: patatin [Desulfuromonadales bacterium C00003068]